MEPLIESEKITLGEINPEFSKGVTPLSPEVQTKPKTQRAILIGVVIVLILTIATIVIVLKYAPQKSSEINTVVVPAQPTTPTVPVVEDEQTKKLNSQGASTEISDMQKDLDDTTLDNIDKDLEGLETLLQ